MKVPEKYLDELAKEIIGDDVTSVLHYLKDKDNVSEFKIAEKLTLTINQTRNILYRLNEHDLVSFTRKKDKKKGWYIYFWTLDTHKLHHLLLDHKKRKIDLLTKMINEETQTLYYICPNNCLRTDNEVALEYQFKCPECNNILKEENKERRVEAMKNQLTKITQDYEELNQLLTLIHTTPERKPRKEKTKKPTPTHKTTPPPHKPKKTSPLLQHHHKTSLLKTVRKKIFKK